MQGYSFQGVAVSAKPVLNFNCFFFFCWVFFSIQFVGPCVLVNNSISHLTCH